MQLAGPFYRVFTNTLGNGRWIDTYLCGLLPPHADRPRLTQPRGARQ